MPDAYIGTHEIQIYRDTYILQHEETEEIGMGSTILMGHIVDLEDFNKLYRWAINLEDVFVIGEHLSIPPVVEHITNIMRSVVHRRLMNEFYERFEKVPL